MRTTGLPAPSAEAQAASRALGERLAARIAAGGGRIGFDAFQQCALYEPGLGYYSGGSRTFGAGGDFVTAPELGALFAGCLAAQCAQWFEQGVPRRVVEFGAGTGALAAELLGALGAMGVDGVDYEIVELSAPLRERQRAAIGRRVPEAAARVAWLDRWPGSIAGVVVGNELLDALPVKVFRLQGDRVLERGVALDAAGGPCWADAPADAAFESEVRALLQPVRDAWGAQWPDDYVGEVGQQARAWVAEAARRLAHGALLLVDYGFPRAELYHPQRSQGTLMCHYRHAAHGDPFLWPGLQDVTAHVDFTAVAQAAAGEGLALLGYTSQANFLLSLGLVERFAAARGDDPVQQARRAREVQTLVSEAEMGELFKAIAFGRGLPDAAAGFARRDRRGALSL